MPGPEQASFESAVAAKTRDTLRWLEAHPERRGVIVAGRPYHMDPRLLHGIDEVLGQLGFAVLAPLGVEGVRGELPAPPPAASGVTYWKAAKRLLRLADCALAHPQLDLVMLQSFNCGYDAVSLGDVRERLQGAGRPFTALKIDEMSDTAHIRIRLRTMAEAIRQCSRRRQQGDAPSSGAVMPAPSSMGSVSAAAVASPSPSESGAVPDGADVLPQWDGMGPADLQTARAFVPADICFTAAALMAHAVNAAQEGRLPETLRLPRVCRDCVTDALPHGLERVCGAVPQIQWVDAWPDGSLPELPAAAEGAVRIGIVGNPLLCFDAYMNEGVLDLLVSLGAVPVLPDPAHLFVDDVRYLKQLDEFAAQGVDGVLYLQSFACLKGHVQGRGALRQLSARYPTMPVTIIDYDPESSALNRENRIRLAVEGLMERRREG